MKIIDLSGEYTEKMWYYIMGENLTSAPGHFPKNVRVK